MQTMREAELSTFLATTCLFQKFICQPQLHPDEPKHFPSSVYDEIFIPVLGKSSLQCPSLWASVEINNWNRSNLRNKGISSHRKQVKLSADLCHLILPNCLEHHFDHTFYSAFNLVILYYQLSWLRKLTTVADVSTISPSSEQMGKG